MKGEQISMKTGQKGKKVEDTKYTRVYAKVEFLFLLFK